MAIKIQGTTVIDNSQNLTLTGTPTFSSNGAVQLPSGTSAQRPTAAAGKIRFNSELGSFEGYDGGAWGEIGGGVTLNAVVTDVLSVTDAEISAVDNNADAIVGWDNTANTLTYLTATQVRSAINVDIAGTDNSTDITLAASADILLALSGQELSFDTQIQNTILAAPTGATGVPTFRTLVAADIPDLSDSYEISGTVSTHESTYNHATFITSAAVTYENLSANGDIGTGATQVAQGDHLHTGVYEPADATIIKQADVDDIPVNGATTVPVSSNWAFDHVAASDPHPGYRLESVNISLTADITGLLPLANGGTNANLTAVNGGAVYSTGSAFAITAAGSSGQVLTSNGASAPTWQTLSGFETTNDDASSSTHYPVTVTTSGGNTARTSSTKLYFVPSSGQFSATSFQTLSDITQKINVHTASSDKIELLRGVEFQWADNGSLSSGVIAQELEQVLPHLVVNNEQGQKTVNYNGIVAYLIETVKSLDKRVKELESYVSIT